MYHLNNHPSFSVMPKEVLESTVALPEPTESRERNMENSEAPPEDDHGSDTNQLKRRSTVVADAESEVGVEGKRRRLSIGKEQLQRGQNELPASVSHDNKEEGDYGTQNAETVFPEKSDQKPAGGVDSQPRSAEMDGNRAPRRRAAGKPVDQAEERKRGRRLFGALLGTLSGAGGPRKDGRRRASEGVRNFSRASAETHSPTTPLKNKEEFVAERKRDQITYMRQAMHVRHSNMLAMAHFLKTTTEPPLYYKPWKCQEKEQETITRQIEDVKAVIEEERERFSQRHPQKGTGGEVKTKQQEDGAPQGEQETLVSNETDKSTEAKEKHSADAGGEDAVKDAVAGAEKKDRIGPNNDSDDKQEQSEMKEPEKNQVEHPDEPHANPEDARSTADPYNKTSRDTRGETPTTKDRESEDRERGRGGDRAEDEVMEEHGEDTVIY